jgi:hypothetical protein
LQTTAVRLPQSLGDDYACHFFPEDLLFPPAKYSFARSVPMCDAPGSIHSHDGIEGSVKQQLEAARCSDSFCW